MQFIFDHIVAIIVGSVVVLVMMANYMRTLEDGIEDTSSYVAKTNALDLAAMIEKDLMMTLHRFETSEDPFVWPIVYDSDGRTSLFRFYRDSLNNLGSTVHLFTNYRLQFVDTLAVQTRDSTGYVEQAVFEVVREECSTTTLVFPCTPVYTGHSAPLVTDFRVTPMRMDKSQALNFSETHYLKFSFVMLPPYQSTKQVVNKLHWSTMLQVQPF